MTFYDLLLAAQLMSEERVGKPVREHQRQQAHADQRSLSKLERFKG